MCQPSSKPNAILKGPKTVPCEFCQSHFKPRPQTRNPRACTRDRYQKLRQRDNQAKGRQREHPAYDSHYHDLMRKKRQAFSKAFLRAFVSILTIGARFKDLSVDEKLLSSVLDPIFKSLGVRALKKLWPELTIQTKASFTG